MNDSRLVGSLHSRTDLRDYRSGFFRGERRVLFGVLLEQLAGSFLKQDPDWPAFRKAVAASSRALRAIVKVLLGFFFGGVAAAGLGIGALLAGSGIGVLHTNADLSDSEKREARIIGGSLVGLVAALALADPEVVKRLTDLLESGVTRVGCLDGDR